MTNVPQSRSVVAGGQVKNPGVIRFSPEARLPTWLTSAPRWVNWSYRERDGKQTKVPHDGGGQEIDANAPQAWRKFEPCRFSAGHAGAGAGVGFALGDGFVGIDFDHVLDPDGNPSEAFQQLLAPLRDVRCWAERSPSGTGVKFVLKADSAEVARAASEITGRTNKCRHKIAGRRAGIKEVEFFHGGGFFTITATPWGLAEWEEHETPDDGTAAVVEVIRAAQAMTARQSTAVRATAAPLRLAHSLTDEEVLAKLFSASNGHAAREVYGGSDAEHGGDASAGDLALANYLAFYAGPNGRDQVARMLRASGRYREKLDREDYVTATVERAFQGRTDFYDPAQRRVEPAKPRVAKSAAEVVTEFGLVDAFVDRYRGKLVRTDQGRWYQLDGAGVFQSLADPLGMAMDTVRHAVVEGGGDRPKLERLAVAHAVVRGAHGKGVAAGGLAIRHEELDADGWLLGTPAGVVDLRTGALRPGTASDYVSKSTRVAPAGSADQSTCPAWLTFMETVADPEVGRFLQRWAGYTLTGDMSEHAILWLTGPSGTGKSTYMETIQYVLGGYGVTMAAEVLTTDGVGHPTSVAALAGARFASCSEFPEGMRLNEARIKRMSGGDTMRARFMRQDEFEFQMVAKMVAGTNFKPRLVEVSDAMTRRLQIVEFGNKLDQSPIRERVRGDLRERLRQEAPGILRWMLDGLRDLLANRAQGGGLNPPATIRNATAAYMDAQDHLTSWFDECFTYRKGGGTFVLTKDLLASHSRWAAENHADLRLSTQRLQDYLYQRFGIQSGHSPRHLGTRQRGYLDVAQVSAVYGEAHQRADGCSD